MSVDDWKGNSMPFDPLSNSRRIRSYMQAHPKLAAAWFLLCATVGITLGTVSLMTASSQQHPTANRLGSIWFYLLAIFSVVLLVREIRRINTR